MPSSKNKDYDVEKIVSKRTDENGRIFYLIKWKGYSSSDNSWEPENHVANCQNLIKAFKAEQAKKKNLNSNPSERRTSQRSTRSNLSPSKQSTNKNERPTRTSNRTSSARQSLKRAFSNDSSFTDDEYDNGYIEKKLNKSSSSKRSRKSTTDTDITPSIDSHDSDILDMAKLDRILDVRRNKKTNIIEYHIEVKKNKKPIWIKSDRLTEDYTQQVVDFLEEKYV